MREHGIGCSVHFIPLHLHPYYKRNYGYESDDFPIATAEYERILSLLIYPKLSNDEVFYVIDTIKISLLKARNNKDLLKEFNLIEKK